MIGQDFSGKGELVVGTVRGFRRWDVKDGALKAVSWGTKWAAGVNTASCRMPFSRFSAHVTASKTCTCGFYAYFDTKDAFHSGAVEGVIEGYGRVTMGSKGFRAEKARILGLVAPRFHVNGSVIGTLAMVGWMVFVTGPMASRDVFPLILNLLSLVAWILLMVLTVSTGGWSELVAFRPKLRKQLRERYPDIPLFRSRKALLRAFPLEPAEYAHLKAAA